MTKTVLNLSAAALALAVSTGGPQDLGLAFKDARAAKGNDVIRATTFVPIFKVDAETRTVYGRLADEALDLTGEIFDYDSSAPLFRAWSEKVAKATGGRSVGNLRIMHGLKVAGKLTEIEFDDTAKTIDIAAEVVDDAEWAMVEKGCYTGFSLGGKYQRKWKDKPTGKTRYTVDPFEASLVDLPCIPSCSFQLGKAGGVVEDVAFQPWEPTASDTAAKAQALAGDGADWTGKIDEARDALKAEHVAEFAETAPPVIDEAAEAAADEPSAETGEAAAETPPAEASEAAGEPAAEPADGADGAQDEAGAEVPAAAEGADDAADKAAGADHGFEQVWRDKADGTFHASKALARKHRADVSARREVSGNALSAALATLKAATGGEAGEGAEAEAFDPTALGQAFAEFRSVKALFDDTIAGKGLSQVRSLAGLINELEWMTDTVLWEASHERDGSAVPAQLLGHLRGLGATLVAMTREEVAEMVAQLQRRGVEIGVLAGDDTGKAAEVVEAIASKAEGDAGTPARVMLAEDLHAQVVTRAAELAVETQTAHDEACAAGASCAAPEAEAEDGEAMTAKVGRLEAEGAALKAQVSEATGVVTAAAEAMKAMRGELDALKAQPAASAPRNAGATAVSKAADGHVAEATAGGSPDQVIRALVETHGADAVSKALIRDAQSRPMTMTPS